MNVFKLSPFPTLAHQLAFQQIEEKGERNTARKKN